MCYCQFLLLCLLVFVLCWCSYVGCIDICNCYFFLDWSLDHYVVSFLISCNVLYFKVYFAWYEDCQLSFASHLHGIYFCLLTFSLYVFLDLKWISCRQHIYGSCFGSPSSSLCLWVGYLIHLHLNNYWYICSYCIFLIVWDLFCRSIFFSCISWLYKSI